MKKSFAVLLCIILMILSACAPADEPVNNSSTASESSESSLPEESNSITEESTDSSAPIDLLIGSTITVTNHSKTIDNDEIKEITEYSNGIKVETRHCYFDKTLEQISTISIDVTQDEKYIYKSYENYDENGELEQKSFYSYNDKGELLEIVSRDYRNHSQTIIYSNNGAVQQHFYGKDADSFKIEFHDENGYSRKTYIDGEMIGYEKMFNEGDARLYEIYGEDMRLLRKARYGNGDDDSWVDHYLDDGRIFHITSESDGQVLWVYTDDISEMKRITDFNMETHAYSFYNTQPADGVTESEAEEHLADYVTALKEVKKIEKLWGVEFYGWEDVDW